MRVTMHHQISGTRNGAQWPAAGESIDLPDDEAAALVTQGAAVEADGKADPGDLDIAKATKSQLLEFAAAAEPPIDVDPAAKVADLRAAISTELENREAEAAGDNPPAPGDDAAPGGETA